jgi:formylglycine-generating enzyme required for sulfatase activity
MSFLICFFRLFILLVLSLSGISCCLEENSSQNEESRVEAGVKKNVRLVSENKKVYPFLKYRIFSPPDWELPARVFEGQYRFSRNTIGVDFVFVPAGTFLRGAGEQEGFAPRNELPRHQVTITKPFFMSVTEITQVQWDNLRHHMLASGFLKRQVPPFNKSAFKSPDRPVEMVSWLEVESFIKALNLFEDTDKYRLPTEAEWEYAARAGSDSAYCYGAEESFLRNYGWYRAQLPARTEMVAGLRPNAWGFFDMHGNVWEWVQDLFDENYYSRRIDTDPAGPRDYRKDGRGAGGDVTYLERVKRGGSWGVEGAFLRSAYRGSALENTRSDCLGFRLVREFGY